jgi:hypothetical protein
MAKYYGAPEGSLQISRTVIAQLSCDLIVALAAIKRHAEVWI